MEWVLIFENLKNVYMRKIEEKIEVKDIKHYNVICIYYYKYIFIIIIYIKERDNI